MERTVVIISKKKEPDENGSAGYIIESRFKITESDIEKLALNDFLRDNSRIDHNREYFAEIEETRY